MRKLIALVLFAILISAATYAQTPIPTRKYEYAIVHLDEQLKNKITISYGNKKEEDFSEIKKIKLEGGVLKNTNNLIDALNYMDEQGYELVSSFCPIYNYSTYIFRRELKK